MSLDRTLRRWERFASFEASAEAQDLSGPGAIRRLLADLGQPQESYRIVHVVGTCGKGLTASMIAAILSAAGKKTGLYTSPYVCDLREGVQIDGRWISEDGFAETLGRVVHLSESYRGRLRLSRFDLMTATALLHFAGRGVELAVVEAGLGGRFDSTNVTDPALVVLTTVDHDHLGVLGSSLAEIAEHKLGVLRDRTPVVLAEQRSELRGVLLKKLRAHRGLVAWNRQVETVASSRDVCELRWPDGGTQSVVLPRHLPARIYRESLRTALVAGETLVPGSRAGAAAALRVAWPGRLDRRENLVYRGQAEPFRRVVFDGCHNPASMRACLEQLADWRIGELTLVLGMSADKLTAPLGRPLAALCRRAAGVLLTPFDSPRSASPELLRAFLTRTDAGLGPRLGSARSLDDAVARASETDCQTLVIAGSLYLVREALARFRRAADLRPQ